MTTQLLNTRFIDHAITEHAFNDFCLLICHFCLLICHFCLLISISVCYSIISMPKSARLQYIGSLENSCALYRLPNKCLRTISVPDKKTYALNRRPRLQLDMCSNPTIAQSKCAMAVQFEARCNVTCSLDPLPLPFLTLCFLIVCFYPIVSKPDSRTNVEAGRVHCNQCVGTTPHPQLMNARPKQPMALRNSLNGATSGCC